MRSSHTFFPLLLLLISGCGSESSPPASGDGSQSSVPDPIQVTIDSPVVPEGRPEIGALNLRDNPVVKNTTENARYVSAADRLENLPVQTASAGQAKNVILFVGDGMGLSTVTTARILEGQKKGLLGEENSLSFDNFAYTGLSKTYNVDSQTADSAGTMTALMTGVKTDAGILGLAENVVKGDCRSGFGNELTTALELAELAGLSTGVVTTARLTHATPAAAFAKSADRAWEDDVDLIDDAKNNGCVDIARQMVEFEQNLTQRFGANATDGIEVLMGGGRLKFLPTSQGGSRQDGRDLISQWRSQYPSGAYVESRANLNSGSTDSATHLFGLFADSHMSYEQARVADAPAQPSLTEMTTSALDLLKRNTNGYFLVVESGRIDHGHHAGSAHAALEETVEFSNAVRAALDSTDSSDTLIIVTADHSHVFGFAGHPKRGNPILDKVVQVGANEYDLDESGLPYATLSYINGRGFRFVENETNADVTYSMGIQYTRVDLSSVDTTNPGFFQEALVPLEVETHGAEDVAIYATGPGASLVRGTMEQSQIFHIMNYAASLEAKANSALNRTR